MTIEYNGYTFEGIGPGNLDFFQDFIQKGLESFKKHRTQEGLTREEVVALCVLARVPYKVETSFNEDTGTYALDIICDDCCVNVIDGKLMIYYKDNERVIENA
jgi:hypothetical protein